MEKNESTVAESTGIKPKDLDVGFQDGKVVVSGAVEHVSKYVEVELTGKVKIKPDPIIDVVVDQIEKIIPGDQKELAEELKAKIIEALKKL